MCSQCCPPVVVRSTHIAQSSVLTINLWLRMGHRFATRRKKNVICSYYKMIRNIIGNVISFFGELKRASPTWSRFEFIYEVWSESSSQFLIIEDGKTSGFCSFSCILFSRKSWVRFEEKMMYKFHHIHSQGWLMLTIPYLCH